ncbi:MAG: hypothetical protein AB4041_20095 [Microcystaceae cyanobacterium]
MSFNPICKGFALTSLVISSTLMVNLDPAISQSSRPDKITFSCKEIFDRASGERIHATLVWNPEKRENQRFIGWKSEYFSKTISTKNDAK